MSCDQRCVRIRLITFHLVETEEIGRCCNPRAFVEVSTSNLGADCKHANKHARRQVGRWAGRAKASQARSGQAKPNKHQQASQREQARPARHNNIKQVKRASKQAGRQAGERASKHTRKQLSKPWRANDPRLTLPHPTRPRPETNPKTVQAP